MSETIHLRDGSIENVPNWCATQSLAATTEVAKATCLACLLACAEYGSEARHRYEVCRENGART